MKKLFLLCLSLIILPLLNTAEVSAQKNKVEIRFEAEGMQVKPREVIIIFHTTNASFAAKFKNKHIIVPNAVLKEEQLNVQMVWNNYSMLFQSIPRQELDEIWTVGVDKAPLTTQNESLRSRVHKEDELVVLYYLTCGSKAHIVEIFK